MISFKYFEFFQFSLVSFGSSIKADNINFSCLQFGDELFSGELGESPFSGKRDFLPSREFHGGFSEGFHGATDIGRLDPDGHKRISDVDPADFSVGLAPGLPHALLESVGSGATEHFVDADHMPRVDSNSQMVSVFAQLFGEMLVAGDTGGF